MRLEHGKSASAVEHSIDDGINLTIGTASTTVVAVVIGAEVVVVVSATSDAGEPPTSRYPPPTISAMPTAAARPSCHPRHRRRGTVWTIRFGSTGGAISSKTSRIHVKSLDIVCPQRRAQPFQAPFQVGLHRRQPDAEQLGDLAL